MMIDDDPLQAYRQSKASASVDPLEAYRAAKKKGGNIDLRTASADDTQVTPKSKTISGEPVGHIEGIARSLNRALPGASDVEGAIDVLTNPSEWSHPIQAWQQHRAEDKARAESYQREHPIASGLATGVGMGATLPIQEAVAPAEAEAAATGLRGLAQNVGRGAKTGAGYGAAFGGSEADDPSAMGRLKAALFGGTTGALVGGTLGGTVPLAAKIPGLRSAPATEATNPSGKAAQVIADQMAKQGEDRAAVIAKVAKNQDVSGVRPEVLGDYSRAARGMTADVTRVQTPESARLTQQLEQRNVQAPERVGSDVTQAAGPNVAAEGGRDAIERLTQEKTAIGKQFDAVSNMRDAKGQPIGFSDHPLVERALGTPVGKQLARSATQEAANDLTRQLPTMQVVTKRREAVGPKSLIPQGTPVEQVAQSAEPKFENPILQAMVDKAGTPEQKANIIARLREQGAPEIQPKTEIAPAKREDVIDTRTVPSLDTRAIHQMFQRGVDMIQSGFSEDGTKLTPQDAKDVQHVLGLLKGAVQERNPALLKLMNQYEQKSQRIKAAEFGLNAPQYSTFQGPQGSVPEPAIGEGVARDAKLARTGLAGAQQAFQRMGKDQTTLARKGALTSLQDALAGVERTPSAANQTLKQFPKSPEGEAFRSLFLGKTGRLENALERERAMAATGNVTPELATKAELSPEEAALQAATAQSHVPSIKYAATKGALGAVQSLYRPKAGPIAEALGLPVQDAIRLMQNRERGMQDLGQLQNALRRMGIYGAIGGPTQWQR